ncbi:MAG: hypothetical protein UX30_C0003G0121 [Candidatus Saccharibacteria bacterium GW2011_GWA2_46_10]|nr:MAG: hypothetical protein UX30_C0003G0121 [Candidatus Saccharibacteria bacterium GW2011_GWA2_46_10]
MTPIRSSMSKTSSDLFKTNQTSNGVYPVSTSPLSYIYHRTLDGKYSTSFRLTLLLKAEV